MRLLRLLDRRRHAKTVRHIDELERDCEVAGKTWRLPIALPWRPAYRDRP